MLSSPFECSPDLDSTSSCPSSGPSTPHQRHSWYSRSPSLLPYPTGHGTLEDPVDFRAKVPANTVIMARARGTLDQAQTSPTDSTRVNSLRQPARGEKDSVSRFHASYPPLRPSTPERSGSAEQAYQRRLARLGSEAPPCDVDDSLFPASVSLFPPSPSLGSLPNHQRRTESRSSPPRPLIAAARFHQSLSCPPPPSKRTASPTPSPGDVSTKRLRQSTAD